MQHSSDDTVLIILPLIIHTVITHQMLSVEIEIIKLPITSSN